MRQFYLEYRNKPNLQQLVGEIPWGQNLLILSKVKEDNAKLYYLKATHEYGWTRDILRMQINSQHYERQVLAKKQHNFHATLPKHLAEQADQTMKDVYTLDLLGITGPVVEAEIERRMVSKIKDVILELGYGGMTQLDEHSPKIWLFDLQILFATRPFNVMNHSISCTIQIVFALY